MRLVIVNCWISNYKDNMKSMLSIAMLLSLAIMCLAKVRPRMSRTELREKYAQFLKYRSQIKSMPSSSRSTSYTRSKLSKLLYRKGKMTEVFHWFRVGKDPLTCVL